MRVSAKWTEKQRWKSIVCTELGVWKIDWNAPNVAPADEACYVYQVSSWVWMNWAIMFIWSSLAVELYQQQTIFYRQQDCLIASQESNEINDWYVYAGSPFISNNRYGRKSALCMIRCNVRNWRRICSCHYKACIPHLLAVYPLNERN